MRYLPHTESEIQNMLKVIGASGIDDLFDSIPEGLKQKQPLNLPQPLSEIELLKHLNGLAAKNKTDAISFLGAGAYRHHVPAAVLNLASRSEFVTPYTPYQPEISQGTLQTIFEYQAMICRLFEMDVSNASHYDGATATADAALLAVRVTKRKKMLVANSVHPEYVETIKTILAPSGTEVIIIPNDNRGCVDRSFLKEALAKEAAGLVVGYPNFFGVIDSLTDLSEKMHASGGLFITSTCEPLSLGLIEAPGLLGADIACAEGQSFGGGLNFGGPYLGIFAAKEKFLRQMPGRIVGKTRDADGKEGFVLTFATREQHIRREKATSNICSNEALCVTKAAIFLSLMGEEGFVKLSQLNYAKAEYAKDVARRSSLVTRFNGPTFNEFVVDLDRPADEVVSALADKGIYAGVALGRFYPELANCLLVCVTEMNSREEIDKLVEVLSLRA